MTEFQARVSGELESPLSEFVATRDDALFASFCWRTGSDDVMGLFIPGDDHLVEWGAHNLVGYFTAAGADRKRESHRHTDLVFSGGFATTGLVEECVFPDGSHAVDHHISFTALRGQRLGVFFDLAIAAQDAVLTRQEGLRLYYANDIFNGNRRTIRHAGGSFEIVGLGGEREVVRLPGGWVNVDDKLGVVGVAGPSSFLLRGGNYRNAPWGSLLFDVIDYGYTTVPTSVAGGELLRDLCYLLVAGDAQATRDWLAGAPELLAPAPLVRVLVLRPDLAVAANFSDTDATVEIPVDARRRVIVTIPAMATTVVDGQAPSSPISRRIRRRG